MSKIAKSQFNKSELLRVKWNLNLSRSDGSQTGQKLRIDVKMSIKMANTDIKQRKFRDIYERPVTVLTYLYKIYSRYRL